MRKTEEERRRNIREKKYEMDKGGRVKMMLREERDRKKMNKEERKRRQETSLYSMNTTHYVEKDV